MAQLVIISQRLDEITIPLRLQNIVQIFIFPKSLKKWRTQHMEHFFLSHSKT